MRVSPDNQPKISLEENVSKSFDSTMCQIINLKFLWKKMFRRALNMFNQQRVRNLSTSSYNILLAYTVKLQIFTQIY